MSRLGVLAAALAALAAVLLSGQTAQAQVWSANLTVDHASRFAGCSTSAIGGELDSCATSTVLSDDDFTHGGITYTVARLARTNASATPGGGPLHLQLSTVSGNTVTTVAPATAKTALTGLTLNVGGTAFAIADATANTFVNTLYWSLSGSWTDGQMIAVSLTSGPAKPAKPAGFSATPGNAQVVLKWTDPSDSSITKWQYRQKTTGSYGSWNDVPGGGATTTTYTVPSLMNGTEYTFQIRAVNSAGNGVISRARSATPAAGTTTVIPPPPGAIWSATLTVAYASKQTVGLDLYGCGSSGWYNDRKCTVNTVLADDDFRFGNTDYTITDIHRGGAGNVNPLTLKLNVAGATAKTALASLTLNAGTSTFPIADATASGNTLVWSSTNLGWATGDTVSLSLTGAATADTTAPTVTAGSTGYYANAGLTTALTGAQTSGTDIYTKVTFSEDMKHTKSDGASARPELFYRIGSTDTRYDILDYGDTLASGDCKPNHATNTNVYVCRYTVEGSDTGAFRVKAGTNSVDKASNALGSAYTHAATLTLGTTTVAPAGIWSATLTVKYANKSRRASGDFYGCGQSTWRPNAYRCAVKAVLSDNDFDFNGADYTIRRVYWEDLGGNSGYLVFDPGVAEDDVKDDLGALTLHVGSTAFKIADATVTDQGLRWDVNLGWSVGDRVSLSLTADPDAALRPAKPTGLTATPGLGQVTLSWDDPEDSSITRWLYQWKTPGNQYGTLWQMHGATAATTTYTVPGLTPGTRYTFRILATNDVGSGLYSAEARATPAVPPAPEKPTSFLAIAGDRSVVLRWADPSDMSITKWQYQQKTTGSYGAWKDVPGSTATTIEYTVPNLANGTAYTFQVRAVNMTGNGAASQEWGATPLATATGGDVTAVWNGVQLEVKWYEVYGAEGYRLRWRKDWWGYNRDGRRTKFSGSWQELRLGPEPPLRPTMPNYVFGVGKINPHNTYRMQVFAIVDGARLALAPSFEVEPAPYRSSKVQAWPVGSDADLQVEWDRHPTNCGYEVRWCPVTDLKSDGSCKDKWLEDEAGQGPPRRVSGWGALDVGKYKTEARIGSNYRTTVIGVVTKNGPRLLRVNTGPGLTGDPFYATAYRVEVWGLPTHSHGSPFLIGRTEVRTADRPYLTDDEKTARGLTPQQDPELGSVEGPEALTARIASAPDEHTGKAAFAVRLGFSAALAEGVGKALRNGALTVEGGAVKDVRRVDGRRDLWEVRVRPDGYGAVTLGLAATADCAAEGALCTGDGQALSAGLSHTVPGPVALSVADARVREGPDATVDFAVTLDRAAPGEVTVRYATRDGTAKAGEDFRRARGKLTFAAGETEKTVSVEVLDDAHDEDEETFTLALRKASGAVIADGEAVGTIENDDPMPQAWIARFGRTVASQAVDAVTARLEAGGGGNRVTLGGQQLSLDTPQGRAEAKADVDAVARALGAGADAADGKWDRDRWMRSDEREVSSRTMTGRELLLGSSFHLSAGGGAAGGPGFAAWGRVAHGSFDADEDGVRLDGAVTTGFIGADVASGRWLGGAAVSVSEGDGTFGLTGDAAAESAFGSGTVESTLTSVLPYARYALSERVSVWGLAGWGTGTLTLTLNAKGAEGAEEEKRYRTDLSMTLGAVGARGALLTPEEASGFALALKGDAFFVRTESDAVRSGEGNLAAAQGDASRLRLALDGSRAFDMGGGATLTPSVELGVRHDGGDAETGFGADIGGGLAYSGHGLTAALHGRGLLSHEAGGMRERGFSGSLAWDPRPDTDRGMSLSLTQTVGASASGGADALLGRETLAGLAANDNGADARRLELRFGYGMALFGGGFTGTPNIGVGLSDTGRDYRLGWRLTSAVPGDPGFEVNLDATRSESAGAAPGHGVMLRGAIRW